MKGVSLCSLVLLVAAIVFRIQMVTWTFVAVFWMVAVLMLSSSRLILRQVLSYIRFHGRNLRDVVIVGTNSRAVEYARAIESKPDLGYQLVGFVDDGWSGLDTFRQLGYPLVCGLENFGQFLRENVVDEVVVGLPLKSLYEKSAEIVDLCEKQGIVVRFVSDLFKLNIARSKTEDFGGGAILTVYTGQMQGWPVVVKRMLDFALAVLLLALMCPLLLIVAVCIKVTSAGPVLFSQERVGLNKRSFRLYKFRTMGRNAEAKIREIEHLNEASGPVFKIRSDPRITPIGRLLRKTSIDELPQLINVLKGEMSLVGPRPLPVRDCSGFDRDWHRRRFSVRPGITCLWQVNGRSEIPFEQWMQLDMEYIDRWSLWLDLKILVKTIPAVLRGSGAV